MMKLRKEEKDMNKIMGKIENNCVEAAELQSHIGETVQMHGIVYKLRKMSDFAFVLIRTKRAVVQCIYSAEPLP